MTSTTDLKQTLIEQQEYYNERATEYDNWWEFKNEFESSAKDEAFLNRNDVYEYFNKLINKASKNNNGEKISVLETAPGTGNFTKLFLNNKFKLHCEEGSLEMIQVLKSKFTKEITEMGNDFSISQTDLFSDNFNPTPNSYDMVFMGFFISHIPPTLFDSFFTKCKQALKPNGRLIFIDSYYHKSYQLKAHESGVNNIKLDDNLTDKDYIIERKLANGKTFKIYKICFTAESIMQALSGVGLQMQNGDSVIINSTYVYGSYSKLA